MIMGSMLIIMQCSFYYGKTTTVSMEHTTEKVCHQVQLDNKKDCEVRCYKEETIKDETQKFLKSAENKLK